MEQMDQATGEVREVGIDKLCAALVKAQATARAVGKDKENVFHRYRYASAEAVIEESRTALSAAELALLTLSWGLLGDRMERIEKTKNGERLVVVAGRVDVYYRLVHASGQYLDLHSSTPVITENGRPEDKAELTALTANLSYMLRGLLLLPRDADADASIDARDDTGREPAQRQPGGPPNAGEKQLQDQYIEQINMLKKRFDALTDRGEQFKVLEELQLLPPIIKGLSLDRRPIVAIFNPVKLSMQRALGVEQQQTSAPAAQTAE